MLQSNSSMHQSKLFTKTKKEAPKDEEAINAQLLIRAGFVDKVMAGVYTFLPLGFRVLKNIENIIREEMIKIGGQEILMPTLQPKENWVKTGRWDSLDVLFKIKGTEEKEFALGATHEEIITPLARKFVFSYQDLPLYIFQIQNKFRNELRVKSGLLRGREFMMKDLYSFHTDEKDLDAYYEKVKAAYFKIFERCGIKDLTYLTLASGGTFSKYSHEFQTLADSGEDVIYICNKCKLAVNKEIKNETAKCPDCGSKDFKEEKAIEIGNIFKLVTKYSTPFELKYKDEKGKENEVMMGCYGIGLGRLMGAIVEIFHDDKGMIWPEEVAPFKAHLINLGKSDKTKKFADKVYDSLSSEAFGEGGQKSGIEILYDDREDVSAGEKFADADLIGLPYRLVVSEKTGENIEIKKRSEDGVKLVGEKELIKLLQK